MPRNYLRIAMMSRGIKGKELADILGVSKNTISRILNGDSNPSYNLMCAFIDILGENISADECIIQGSEDYWNKKNENL